MASTGCSRPDVADTNTTSTRDLGAPLAGRSVVVTRSARQSGALIGPLEAMGATVIAFPVIETVEPDDWGPADRAIESLARYDWIVLTSANAVRCFFDRLQAWDMTPADMGTAKIAVVGEATARVLLERGIVADLVPGDYRAEGLVDEFARLGVGLGHHILLPRALEAREILPDTMRERGAAVDVVPVYRTVRAQPDPEALKLITSADIDAVTFTSPSTFRNFREVLLAAAIDADAFLRATAIASIGPVTSDAVRAAGHAVAIEPSVYTVPGLVEALKSQFARD